MAHKRLSVKTVVSDAAGLAGQLRKNASALAPHDGKPFRIGEFFGFSDGKIRKRQFWFSVFAVLAFLYAVLCMTPLVPFNAGLGTFIFGCNAAFGLNYYKNERDKVVPNGIQ